MQTEIITALILFTSVASVTPGPNNIMVLTSAVNYGFKNTIPHITGTSIGVLTLVLAIGFFLKTIVQIYPPIFTAIKIICIIYLLYLAWRIATTRSMPTIPNNTKQYKNKSKPLTLTEAILFQWINPKVWAIAAIANSIFANVSTPTLSIIIIASIYATVAFPLVAIWAICGTALKKALANPKHLKYFNISMAILLLISAIPIALSQNII